MAWGAQGGLALAEGFVHLPRLTAGNEVEMRRSESPREILGGPVEELNISAKRVPVFLKDIDGMGNIPSVTAVELVIHGSRN